MLLFSDFQQTRFYMLIRRFLNMCLSILCQQERGILLWFCTMIDCLLFPCFFLLGWEDKWTTIGGLVKWLLKDSKLNYLRYMNLWRPLGAIWYSYEIVPSLKTCSPPSTRALCLNLLMCMWDLCDIWICSQLFPCLRTFYLAPSLSPLVCVCEGCTIFVMQINAILL